MLNESQFGSHVSAWSERKAVAAHWAKKGGGAVHTRAPGEAIGLRVGDYIDSGADGVEREWVVGQPGHLAGTPAPADHDQHVRDALWSLKGSYSDLHVHMDDERSGAPLPSSGSGKTMRARAASLLWELDNRGKSNPKPLYRGQS